jgi:hypothetical protein
MRFTWAFTCLRLYVTLVTFMASQMSCALSSGTLVRRDTLSAALNTLELLRHQSATQGGARALPHSNPLDNHFVHGSMSQYQSNIICAARLLYSYFMEWLSETLGMRKNINRL